MIRRNGRRLQTSGRTGWVVNGDLWTLTALHHDGSAAVWRHREGVAAVLPADYLAVDAQLGYATTAHRAQGVTIDRARLGGRRACGADRGARRARSGGCSWAVAARRVAHLERQAGAYRLWEQLAEQARGLRRRIAPMIRDRDRHRQRTRQMVRR